MTHKIGFQKHRLFFPLLIINSIKHKLGANKPLYLATCFLLRSNAMLAISRLELSRYSVVLRLSLWSVDSQRYAIKCSWNCCSGYLPINGFDHENLKKFSSFSTFGHVFSEYVYASSVIHLVLLLSVDARISGMEYNDSLKIGVNSEYKLPEVNDIQCLYVL